MGQQGRSTCQPRPGPARLWRALPAPPDQAHGPRRPQTSTAVASSATTRATSSPPTTPATTRPTRSACGTSRRPPSAGSSSWSLRSSCPSRMSAGTSWSCGRVVRARGGGASAGHAHPWAQPGGAGAGRGRSESLGCALTTDDKPVSQPRRPTAHKTTPGATPYCTGPPPPWEAWGGGEGPAHARTQHPPRVRQPVPSAPRAPASWLVALSGAHGETPGSEGWARTSVSPDGLGSEEGRDAPEPPRDGVGSLTVCA